MEHLAIKYHWTEREAAIGDVIPVSSLKPKMKPGNYGRGRVKGPVIAWSHSTEAKGNNPERLSWWQFRGFAACRLDIPEVDLAMQSCPLTASIHQVDRQNRKGRVLHLILSAQGRGSVSTSGPESRH